MRADDLARHLAKGVGPLYVIHGDEPLLALEAGDAVRTAARAAGCEQRETLVAEAHFRWDALLAANASVGLFGDRKLIDLRIPSGKPGVEGAAALERYAADPNPDNITLVTLPRIDGATHKSAWFTALTRAAVTIAVQPVERADLPRWIAARLARQQQAADAATLEFLAELCEGNLLAARQEIDKLALLLPPGELTHDDVEHAVADVARFDVFTLSAAWLAGDATRALRILTALQQEGEPLTLIIWQLSEDVHAIAAVHQAMRTGTPMSGAIRNARVWGKRQAALEAAVKRIAARDVAGLLSLLAPLDALAKGLGAGDPWDALVRAALAVCGHPLSLAAAL
ncbi:MAG: DNA polymerase III subunit delta [Casimicrobiaceae bacterium]